MFTVGDMNRFQAVPEILQYRAQTAHDRRACNVAVASRSKINNLPTNAVPQTSFLFAEASADYSIPQAQAHV